MKQSENSSDLKNTPGPDRVSRKQVSVAIFIDCCQGSGAGVHAPSRSGDVIPTKDRCFHACTLTDLFSLWILQHSCRTLRRTTQRSPMVASLTNPQTPFDRLYTCRNQPWRFLYTTYQIGATPLRLPLWLIIGPFSWGRLYPQFTVKKTIIIGIARTILQTVYKYVILRA